jgi:hypothetical protein
MAYAPEPGAAISGGYPVDLLVTDEREINRLWGIPIAGVLVRMFLAIPHFVVLSILGIGMQLWFLVGWIWILAYGRVPAIAVTLLTEVMHRGSRVAGYTVGLLPGEYPRLEPGAPGPTDVRIHLESLAINRLWGIPFLGFAVRILVTIPHLIVLAFLAVGVVLVHLVLWIPILSTGRYPGWAASFFGAVLRFGVRVQAYLLLMPVPYPPLSFD